MKPGLLFLSYPALPLGWTQQRCALFIFQIRCRCSFLSRLIPVLAMRRWTRSGNEIGIRTPKGYFLVDSSRFLLASPADDEISPAKDAYALHYFIPWQQDSFLLTHSRGASWALDKWEPVFLDLSKKGWAQYNSAALGALSDNPRAGNALNYYFHEDGSLSDVMGTRYYLLSRLIAQDRTWMAAHRRAISAGRLKKYQELKDDSLVTAPYHEDLEALFEEARKYR